MMDKSFKSGLDVIYLTSCALHGITPDKGVIEAMDLEAVFGQAKRHKMLSITYMAIESCRDTLEPELARKWGISVPQAVKSSLMYSVEREKLYRFMDENEIAYLPLKGIIMQDIYPKLGMRQMADNDILIDIDKRHLVRDYMVKNGYKSDGYGKDIHDVYIKPPIYNFEIHVYLAIESVDAVFYNYYLDIWQRLQRQDDKRSEYRFSVEDFYIYTLVHAYKHINYTGGIGIKPLTDIFVYLRRYEDSLDRGYLDAELERIRLTAFEKNMRLLSKKIFDAEAAKENRIEDGLNEEERQLLKFFIDSGSFGNKDTLYRGMIDRFANGEGEITRTGKIRYLLSRLFPTGPYIRENYPFFHRHKILLPVLWVYRFFTKIFVKFGHVCKELKFISKQK